MRGAAGAAAGGPGGGRRAAASFPDISPGGRWAVSGEDGLYLTSLRENSSVALNHPQLQGASRAVFVQGVRALVFERRAQLHRMPLPKDMEGFFAFLRAGELIRGGTTGRRFAS